MVTILFGIFVLVIDKQEESYKKDNSAVEVIRVGSEKDSQDIS